MLGTAGVILVEEIVLSLLVEFLAVAASELIMPGLANHDRMVSIAIIRSPRRRRGRAATLGIVAAGRTAGYWGAVTRWAARFGRIAWRPDPVRESP